MTVAARQRALPVPPFAVLLAAHGLSSLGQSLFPIAVSAIVYERTGSAAWAAVAAASRLVPYLAGSPLAGVIASRRGLRQVLATSGLARGLLMYGLAAAAWFEGSLVLMIVLATVATACGTASYPSVVAATPAVVPGRKLVAANAWVTTLESGGFILGPAAGGLILAAGPAANVFIAAAAIFGLLVVATAWLPPASPPSTATGADQSSAGPGPTFVAVAAMAVTINAVYGAAVVLLLGFAGSSDEYGFLNAAFGAGGLATVLLVLRGSRLRPSLAVLSLVTVLACAPFAALTASRGLGIALALVALAGIGGVLVEVLATTRIQLELPRRSVARAIGLLDALLVGAIAAGTALAPLLLQAFGTNGALVVVGIGFPALGITVALGAAARARHLPGPPARRLLTLLLNNLCSATLGPPAERRTHE